MGWFIAGGLLLLVLLAMLWLDIRDHNFRPRFNRQAARKGRQDTYNDAVMRGLQEQHRGNISGS